MNKGTEDQQEPASTQPAKEWQIEATLPDLLVLEAMDELPPPGTFVFQY